MGADDYVALVPVCWWCDLLGPAQGLATCYVANTRNERWTLLFPALRPSLALLVSCSDPMALCRRALPRDSSVLCRGHFITIPPPRFLGCRREVTSRRLGDTSNRGAGGRLPPPSIGGAAKTRRDWSQAGNTMSVKREAHRVCYTPTAGTAPRNEAGAVRSAKNPAADQLSSRRLFAHRLREPLGRKHAKIGRAHVHLSADGSVMAWQHSIIAPARLDDRKSFDLVPWLCRQSSPHLDRPNHVKSTNP